MKKTKTITEGLQEEVKRIPEGIQEEDPVEKTLINLKSLLEIDAEYIVNLYKEDPRTRKFDFVDQINEIDARLMKNIKDQYGPGKYMIRVLDQEGLWVSQGGKSVFTISGSAAAVQAAPVQASAEDQEMKMLEKMAKYKALFGGPANDTSSIMIEQMKGIMDLNRSMITQSKTMLEDQIRLMQEAKGDGETNMFDVILEGINQLPMVLAASTAGAPDQAAIEAAAAAAPAAGPGPDDPEKKKAALDNAKKIYYTMRQKVVQAMFKDILVNMVSKSAINADDIELIRNILQKNMPEALVMIQTKTKDQISALLSGAFGVSWSAKQRTNLDAIVDGLNPQMDPIDPNDPAA